ncbi:MAG TPA: DUF2867 domain-containing protein, partial [candidate division Zixibacteria bacterium]|nr:DUF2867 domain-containing protein [candidate division Zixibacteria bacterium]
RPIRRIGGKTGWYYANWLWTFRGWLDRLQGGVGMSRGREDADQLQPGDIIDCWRVDLYEPNRHLRLVAEMKLPGRAWLDFEIATDDRGTRIHQTAIFDPHGFLGILYWFVVTPLHKVLFPGMLRGIAKAAVEQ